MRKLAFRDGEVGAQFERDCAHVGPGAFVGGDAVQEVCERGEIGHLVTELVQAVQIGNRARRTQFGPDPGGDRA